MTRTPAKAAGVLGVGVSVIGMKGLSLGRAAFCHPLAGAREVGAPSGDSMVLSARG